MKKFLIALAVSALMASPAVAGKYTYAQEQADMVAASGNTARIRPVAVVAKRKVADNGCKALVGLDRGYAALIDAIDGKQNERETASRIARIELCNKS